MWYTYALLTYLLSGIGFLGYRFLLKEKLKPKHSKYVIYVILVASLALPFFLVESPTAFEHALAHVDEVSTPTEPVLDEKLSECYGQVASQEGFCHCEKLQSTNLLYYKSNHYYNAMLTARQPAFWVFLIIAGVILLNLLMKISFLWHLKRQAQLEFRQINGKIYRLLRTESNFLAASFTLWHSYILWHPDLDSLTAEEQEAVLLHEVSHLDNRDTWEQIGLAFLQILWLVNPVYYFAKNELSLLNEYIADAFALQKVGNKKLYATLLVKLKEQQQLDYALHFGGNALKARILALISPKQFLRLRFIAPIVAGLIVIMLAAGLTTAPSLNAQQKSFNEYERMYHEHSESGKAVFCKACLHEDLYGGKE